MADVYVNPEELRSFANKLNGFSHFVEEQFNGLGGALSRLGDTWRDQEYQNFVDYFRRVNQTLKVFAEETNQTVPLMLRDADAAEHVHRIKPGV